MSHPLKKETTVQYILLTLLVITCAFVVFRAPIHPSLFGDGYFHVETKTLVSALATRDFAKATPWVHSPGTPLYYLLPYLAVGAGAPDHSYWIAGVIWNFTWGLVATLLMYSAALRISGSIAAGITVAILFVCPMFFYYALAIDSEPATFLGTSLFVYVWSVWFTSSGTLRLRTYGLLLISLLLMTLTRPNMVSLLALGASCMLFLDRQAVARATRPILAVFFVAFLLFLAAFAVTGYWLKRAGLPQQSSFLTHVMIQGAYQFRTEPWDWRGWGRFMRGDSADYQAYAKTRTFLNDEADRTNTPVSTVERRWLIDSFRREPLTWAKMDLMRALASHIYLVNSAKPQAFSAFGLRGWRGYLLVHAALNLAQIVSVVGSILFLFSNRSRIWDYWGLWCPWIALLIFTLLTYCEPRYMFPAQPCLALMSGLWLTPATARVLRRISDRFGTPHAESAGLVRVQGS